MSKILLSISLLFLLSCGSGSGTTEISAQEEKNIVDSVSTAVDEAKKDLLDETTSTSSEIDSLLSDI